MPANRLDKVVNAIVERMQCVLQENEHIAVAIDGRCASGKTTLSAYLQEKLTCPVIHMDDFFLRPEQRTKERLAEPGGNVDYERFSKEVVIPLKNGRDFSYRPYDCHSQALKSPVDVKKNRITIVEGSYSLHPLLWDNYNIHIFLDVDKEVQIERIRKRNGDAMAERFTNMWIPLEEKYFSTFQIREKCELQYKI